MKLNRFHLASFAYVDDAAGDRYAVPSRRYIMDLARFDRSEAAHIGSHC